MSVARSLQGRPVEISRFIPAGQVMEIGGLLHVSPRDWPLLLHGSRYGAFVAALRCLTGDWTHDAPRRVAW